MSEGTLKRFTPGSILHSADLNNNFDYLYGQLARVIHATSTETIEALKSDASEATKAAKSAEEQVRMSGRYTEQALNILKKSQTAASDAQTSAASAATQAENAAKKASKAASDASEAKTATARARESADKAEKLVSQAASSAASAASDATQAANAAARARESADKAEKLVMQSLTIPPSRPSTPAAPVIVSYKDKAEKALLTICKQGSIVFLHFALYPHVRTTRSERLYFKVSSQYLTRLATAFPVIGSSNLAQIAVIIDPQDYTIYWTPGAKSTDQQYSIGHSCFFIQNDEIISNGGRHDDDDL